MSDFKTQTTKFISSGVTSFVYYLCSSQKSDEYDFFRNFSKHTLQQIVRFQIFRELNLYPLELLKYLKYLATGIIYVLLKSQIKNSANEFFRNFRKYVRFY